jgi:hypothetical protein
MFKSGTAKATSSKPAVVTEDDVSIDSADGNKNGGTDSTNELHKRKLKFDKFKKNQEKKKKVLRKLREKDAEGNAPAEDTGSSDDSEDEYVRHMSHFRSKSESVMCLLSGINKRKISDTM